MCHDNDSRPPDPPFPDGQAHAAAQGTETVLIGGDGNRFRAYLAKPEAGEAGGPGVVLLPDVRGLHPFYEHLAMRFAGAGIRTVAIDPFGRTAGVGDRGDDFDWKAHVKHCKPDTVALDVAAAVGLLRAAEGGADAWRRVLDFVAAPASVG